jgi:transposase
VRVDTGRTNTHVYGTLNLQTGEEIAMQSEEMNSEASARHLEMILDANPDVPILLFWDRAPWHRGKAIDQVLEKNPRLEIMRFPPGCPELNPQEHVWKAVRRAVSHNHIETKLPELAEQFLDNLNTGSFDSSFLRKYGYIIHCANFI